MGILDVFQKYTTRVNVMDKTANSTFFDNKELAFKDIEYRALNKLKNSKTSSLFEGELSLKINRQDFCALCLSYKLIRYSTVEEDKRLFTINDYKEFLCTNSLKTSGKKNELIQRIEHFNSDFFGKKHYILTEKGFEFLHKYWNTREQNNIKSATELHIQKLNKYQIKESEFQRFKEQLSFAPTENDVIWGILNERILYFISGDNYIESRNTYLNMALLLEEEKNPQRALEFFLVVICYDINGYSSQNKPRLIPWIANRIYYSRIHYDINIAIIAYSQCLIPQTIFSESMFLSLINSIVYSEDKLSNNDYEALLNKYLYKS